jgi:hypothetical protein
MSVDIKSRHVPLPLPVYEAAYGGNSLWVMAGAHRVSVSCAQDGLVPAARQSKLESVEEKIFLRCALRQRECGASDQLSSKPACSSVYAFHNGTAIAVR